MTLTRDGTLYVVRRDRVGVRTSDGERWIPLPVKAKTLRFAASGRRLVWLGQRKKTRTQMAVLVVASSADEGAHWQITTPLKRAITDVWDARIVGDASIGGDVTLELGVTFVDPKNGDDDFRRVSGRIDSPLFTVDPEWLVPSVVLRQFISSTGAKLHASAFPSGGRLFFSSGRRRARQEWKEPLACLFPRGMKALVRLVAERPRRILSVTIGYGSRLAADTQGPCTFGAAAILGELACLTTALVLMPAVIGLVDRRAA